MDITITVPDGIYCNSCPLLHYIVGWKGERYECYYFGALTRNNIVKTTGVDVNRHKNCIKAGEGLTDMLRESSSDGLSIGMFRP